jgi:hypothetical protein
LVLGGAGTDFGIFVPSKGEGQGPLHPFLGDQLAIDFEDACAGAVKAEAAEFVAGLPADAEYFVLKIELDDVSPDGSAA